MGGDGSKDSGYGGDFLILSGQERLSGLANTSAGPSLLSICSKCLNEHSSSYLDAK